MFDYIARRILYAIPILIGVNLITFALFFVVNTPDDMARMQFFCGQQRKTGGQIKAHLPAKHRAGAGAGAVGFFLTVGLHVAH